MSDSAISVADIQALLDDGVDVSDLRNDGGETLLHQAAHRTHDSAVFSILADVCGVDVDALDSRGDTCTHTAVQCDNADALCWLVQAGADVNCRSDDGSTPLHLVGYCEPALYLLAGGADVHARGRFGRTPVHAAALIGEQSIVHVMLGAGADLDTADYRGETARQALVRRGWTVDTERV